MKIIISPAKKMNIDIDTFNYRNLPTFLNRTREIMEFMKSLSYADAKKLWGCNDSIAELNFNRFKEMDLEKCLTPAIMSYEGIQYQYMAPLVLSDHALEYLEKHLRILSGFYGVLKPFDGVTPYRLEMQAKAKINTYKDLYQYWGDSIYHEVCADDHLILNLASKEYAKCIEKHLSPEDRFITCIFGEEVNGKIVQKGTLAKMARGEMVRFMSENQIEDLEEIKAFDRLNFSYRPELSTETEYVFIM